MNPHSKILAELLFFIIGRRISNNVSHTVSVLRQLWFSLSISKRRGGMFLYPALPIPYFVIESIGGVA
jgi:hypothetical protein